MTYVNHGKYLVVNDFRTFFVDDFSRKKFTKTKNYFGIFHLWHNSLDLTLVGNFINNDYHDHHSQPDFTPTQ